MHWKDSTNASRAANLSRSCYTSTVHTNNVRQLAWVARQPAALAAQRERGTHSTPHTRVETLACIPTHTHSHKALLRPQGSHEQRYLSNHTTGPMGSHILLLWFLHFLTSTCIENKRTFIFYILKHLFVYLHELRLRQDS